MTEPLLVNVRFHGFMERFFDWIYDLEDPQCSTPWRRRAVYPLKIVFTLVDILYARAGFLFSPKEAMVDADHYYGTFHDICREISDYYNGTTEPHP